MLQAYLRLTSTFSTFFLEDIDQHIFKTFLLLIQEGSCQIIAEKCKCPPRGLPRNSVVLKTERLGMISAVYSGSKLSDKTNKLKTYIKCLSSCTPEKVFPQFYTFQQS